MTDNEKLIGEITKKIQHIKGCKIASITYLTKKTKELARYNLLLGSSYHNLVEKSILELDLLMGEQWAGWSQLEKDAALEVMNSLKETIEKHKTNEQNSAYTKAGLYWHLGNGVNVNLNDGSCQLFGVLQSKVVLEPGVHKPINSAPLTIAKNKIRGQLSLSKFREFSLDIGNLESARVNGETFET